MANTNRSRKTSNAKAQSSVQKESGLVYVKLPEKAKDASGKMSETSALNDAAQKAERKRRIRAINPKHETW